jgi:hypothetical protein
MTINPEAFRLKDLIAPFVGVPTPGHSLLQAVWPTKIEHLASQHPGPRSLARWSMTVLIPIDRMRRLLVNVWSLVTGEVHLE